MAYMCEISPNQRVYLDCQGNNTVVTMMTGGLGQQQQASNAFPTGEWVTPPEMFAAPQGMVIKIKTAQGDYYIQLQGGSMNVVNASGIAGSEQVQMHQVELPSVTPMTPMPPMQPIMAPMTPMQPMTMGNMQMNNHPMEMRMGNMQMRMGEPGQPPQSAQSAPPQETPLTQPSQSVQATRKFCSQCGFALEASDRFCSGCGHRLV